MRKKVGIIRRNKALARTDPAISIEFISHSLIEDFPYRRSSTCRSELARDKLEIDACSQTARVIVNDHREQARSYRKLDVTDETESPAQIRRTALYLTLAQVPEGKVVSYGQLAELAGLGRAARWVGRTLSQLPGDTKLPWHRVLGAGGRISLPVGSPSGDEQRARLRSEGISVLNNRVDIQRHGWRPVEHSG